jgi:hypothetical protein
MTTNIYTYFRSFFAQPFLEWETFQKKKKKKSKRVTSIFKDESAG